MHLHRGRLILDLEKQGDYHGPSALLASQKIPEMVVRPLARATRNETLWVVRRRRLPVP
jgi:hypothetical protein